MRKNVASLGAGTLMTVVGVVLYLYYADVETPVIGLRQLGLVLAVLGAVELAVTAVVMLRPGRR